MKKFSSLTFLILAFLTIQASAQDIISEVNYPLLEKYIAAAREYYPRRKALDARAEGAKTAIAVNNLSYLDIFNASYFYRPDKNPVLTTPGLADQNAYSVNGFQFGATINIGTYLAKPAMGKRAKAEYRAARYEAQEYDITLGIEVKKRYYTYIQQISQMKINAQSVQDNKNVADNLKYKFEKGEISLDTYNQSRINLASAQTAKIQAEVTYLTAKDALEELVGRPLAEIK